MKSLEQLTRGASAVVFLLCIFSMGVGYIFGCTDPVKIGGSGEPVPYELGLDAETKRAADKASQVADEYYAARNWRDEYGAYDEDEDAMFRLPTGHTVGPEKAARYMIGAGWFSRGIGEKKIGLVKPERARKRLLKETFFEEEEIDAIIAEYESLYETYKDYDDMDSAQEMKYIFEGLDDLLPRGYQTMTRNDVWADTNRSCEFVDVHGEVVTPERLKTYLASRDYLVPDWYVRRENAFVESYDKYYNQTHEEQGEPAAQN